MSWHEFWALSATLSAGFFLGALVSSQVAAEGFKKVGIQVKVSVGLLPVWFWIACTIGFLVTG